MKNKNWNIFYVYAAILTKSSLKHSLCHKDLKSVPKVEANWWEVCFYKGITDRHTNRQPDILDLKGLNTKVDGKTRIETFSMFIPQF